MALPILTYPPQDIYPMPAGHYVAIHYGSGAHSDYAVRVSYELACQWQKAGAGYCPWALLDDHDRDIVWRYRERITYRGGMPRPTL